MTRRIGIYSGSFDPVHAGHVAFAQTVLQTCGLDEVVFLPEQKPRGKANITDIAHRIALIEQAVAATSGLRVLHLASEQFTVQQTLPELHRIFDNSQLTLLVGSDVARTFTHAWEGLDTLLQQVSLAIGMRANDDPNDVTAIMRQLEQDHGIAARYTLVSAPKAEVSSSHIRNNPDGILLLPPKAQTYIRKYRLYGSETARA